MTQPIIFPDPISSVGEISGATLLYFDHPLVMGSPATVIPPVREQSFRLMDLIESRHPPWGPALYLVLEQSHRQSLGAHEALDRLASVRGAALRSVYFSYPAGAEPFSAAREAATELAGRLASASRHITPGTAANDLRRHIFLEAFLECGSDTSALYEYCANLFANHTLEHLLLAAYLLRIAALPYLTTGSGVLLTNPQVAELLAAAVPGAPEVSPAQVTDVVSWEIFRQIISPRLDPLTADGIGLVEEIRESRDAERAALVDRCRDTATQIVGQRGTMSSAELRRYVETRVEPEIAALLRLDKKALRRVIDELLSNSATWVALTGFVAGLASGNPVLSATGAVATLSTVGAAAYKTRVETKSAIQESDLRLLYFIDRRTYPERSNIGLQPTADDASI